MEIGQTLRDRASDPECEEESDLILAERCDAGAEAYDRSCR